MMKFLATLFGFPTENDQIKFKLGYCLGNIIGDGATLGVGFFTKKKETTPDAAQVVERTNNLDNAQ
jgi:hypothetical protein